MVVLVSAALLVLHRLVENPLCSVRVVPPRFAGPRVESVIRALVFWSP